MRAVVVRDGGPVLVDVAVPEPGHGQVRLRVEAAGVNPVDAATGAGLPVQFGLAAPKDVSGLGWDAAGVVDAVGAGVTTVAVGDRVVGLLNLLHLPLGAYAEQVVIDASAVAAIPVEWTAAEWATLPLNGATAWQCLDRLGLDAGQTVLVTGAAGGVGGLAVELAVARGLRVVAVAGQDDERLVRDLGAEFFVPRGDAIALRVRELVPGGVDGVVDAASLRVAALDALRDGGSYVAVLAGAEPLALRDTTVSTVFVAAYTDELAELVSLASAGTLSLRVAQTYPLDQATTAHERLAKGGVRGRLVLIP
ncbi:NADP-dependent oxidoreductase [Actinokineospora sp.]|uniref:NADP-dependent oxidoreductase n=1 Tax=Actinokineospora sp. TaxID=1872133 RepID=UPI0040384ED2